MSDEDKIVSWFESNYKGLLFGVAAGLVILFSYKSYISTENESQLELSRAFDSAVNSFQDGETEAIITFSRINMIDNADNIYTSLASLYAAKIMYDNNQLEESKKFFHHIINNSSDADIINLAIYRKAKILIEQSEYDKAHSLLGDDIDNYQHLELKGDLFYIQKKNQEARKSYSEALLYELTPNERKNILAKINLVK